MFIYIYYYLLLFINSSDIIFNQLLQQIETRKREKMEEKKTYYLSELQREAREEMEERLELNHLEIDEDEIYDKDDIIHEVADNNIPIYTYELLQYASNNFDLIEPNDLAGDNPDVVKIIQSNIYELLMEDLYEYLNERKGE